MNGNCRKEEKNQNIFNDQNNAIKNFLFLIFQYICLLNIESEIMKKTTLILFILLTFIVSAGYTQTENDTEKLSFMRRNFFQVFGGSVFFEGGYTPFYNDSIEIPDPNNYNQNITVRDHHSNSYVTLFCFEYEPRLNLFNYKDFFSISFNMPFISGIQFFDNDGFGAFKNAYIIDFNFFNHSTYNNINEWGGHIGTGLQMTVGPILYKGDLKTDRVWTNWIIRGGLKFPFRSRYTFVDFAFGPGKIIKNDPTFNDGRSAISKLYFGLYAGILLGYE